MDLGRILAISGGAVIGGMGAVMAAPLLLGAVGFTSAGVTAGSYAASMMSAAAIANGGGVAAGSLVSLLQSAGAAGLSVTANAAVACIGGSIGAGIGFVASLFQDEEEKKRQENEMKKNVFWVAASLMPVLLYLYLNGHLLVTAAVCVVAGAGWLAKVCWEESERKRREEETKLMLGIGALAFVSSVYLHRSADRKQRAQ